MNQSHPRMHAGLYVSDLQQSVAFYTAFFGVPPVKVKPGYAKFELAEPALVFSCIENKERTAPGFGHLGFQVATPEDLQIKLWEARKHGLVTREEKETNCCYAKQDKFWVTDPDGVAWEVYFFHDDVETNDAEHAAADVACCSR
jgi:catechol 2,3-dioxygenase-like lactoylglutathione lyase family enzyme